MVRRDDRRRPDELRNTEIFYEGLARVDGSARFSFGSSTSVLASISGPTEVRLAAENPSQATFEVTIRPLSNVPGIESKSLASTIRSVLLPCLLLSQNPRTLIQLVIQSLSPSPAQGKWTDTLIASMINASTLALLNAGSIPLRGVVCAVSVGRLARNDESGLVVDTSQDESNSLKASGCFAFLFSSGISRNSNDGDCTCVWSSWKTSQGTAFDEEELMQARNMASKAARQVWSTMKDSVSRMGAPRSHRLSTQPAIEASGSSDSEDSKMQL